MPSAFASAMIALFGAAIAATAAQAQSVSLSVAGQISPGVYGRVDIGNVPPPVVYAQPVIIAPPPPAVVVPAPVYMHVPPGQAKRWARYCRHYNACGVPVYFVRGPEYERGWDRPGEHHDKHGHDDHGHGHGNGHGHGHGDD